MRKPTDKRNVRVGDAYSYFETRKGGAWRNTATIVAIRDKQDHRQIALDNGRVLYRAKDKLNY